MPAKKGAKAAAKGGLTPEEKAAMKDLVRERSSSAGDGAAQLKAAIAKMVPAERV
ncbi:MAG: hypothetical protein QOI63_1209, partial [Thermoplasmata archaeon]|nr:hypothetical protein [Thermoplasmata archaeon]